MSHRNKIFKFADRWLSEKLKFYENAESRFVTNQNQPMRSRRLLNWLIVYDDDDWTKIGRGSSSREFWIIQRCYHFAFLVIFSFVWNDSSCTKGQRKHTPWNWNIFRLTFSENEIFKGLRNPGYGFWVGSEVLNWEVKWGARSPCAFPMVNSSDCRMGQHRDDDHWEDAPHFIWLNYIFL